MRQIIDAHVHIAPAHLLGSTDARYPVTVEKYGRKLESDGRICQFMPVYMANSCFPTDALIMTMNSTGVDKAVILQSPCLSFNNDVAEAVSVYPDRLAGAMIIDPGDDSCLDEIRHWHTMGLTVIKFEMSPGLGYAHPNLYPHLKFDSEYCEEIWALAETLGLTVVIDTSPIGSPGYQAKAIDKMASKYSSLRFVICHLGFPYTGLRENADSYRQWRIMTDVAKRQNVWFDIAALPSLFREEGYPYTTAIGYVREFIDAYGAEKAIWGSDIPGTLVDATYLQIIETVYKSSLFTDHEKSCVFSLNAEHVYFNNKYK